MTKLASLVLSGFALTVSVAPALANSIIFAQYNQTSASPTLALTSTLVPQNDPSLPATYQVDITDRELVSFSYNVGGTPFIGPQDATLVLTATSFVSGACPTTSSCQSGGFTESGFSGSFTFTLSQPQFGGRNLLSGTFDLLSPGAQLATTVGGTSGTLEATTTSSNLTFTSDFLNFGATTARDATFSLSSIFPRFSAISTTFGNNRFPNNFSAIGSGAFAETIVVVPEPSMFGLLASGLLGGLCLWQRKRRLLHR
jgi:PEP-CTERM motif